MCCAHRQCNVIQCGLWSVLPPKFHGCWLNVYWLHCFAQYAGNKIRSGDAPGVLSLSNDSKIHLSEPTNAGDRQEVEPVNASADRIVICPPPELVSNSEDNSQQRLEELQDASNGKEADRIVICPPPELVSNSEDNSQQRLEELQDASNGKEVGPVYLRTDIGGSLQTWEGISNSKDSPQEQVADSKVAHNENEVDPVHSDTHTRGDTHTLELTSSSEDTPQQHLTELTDQSDTGATTAYRSSWKGEEYLRWYIRVCLR